MSKKKRRTRSPHPSSSSSPRISDHALLRYLERRYGLDVEALAKEVLPDTVLALVDEFGDGNYTVPPAESDRNDDSGRKTSKGHEVIVRDGVVVTVVTEQCFANRKRRSKKDDISTSIDVETKAMASEETGTQQ